MFEEEETNRIWSQLSSELTFTRCTLSWTLYLKATDPLSEEQGFLNRNSHKCLYVSKHNFMKKKVCSKVGSSAHNSRYRLSENKSENMSNCMRTRYF